MSDELKKLRTKYKQTETNTENTDLSQGESFEDLGKRIKGLTYVKSRNLLQINVVFTDSSLRDKKIIAKLEKLMEEHGSITSAVKYLILNS